MGHFCYLNGQILPVQNAQFHINDLGLLRGYGLFDYCRTYYGRPFMRDLHLDRFHCSAMQMDLSLPMGKAELRAIMDELHQRANQPDLAFRLLLTGGYTDDGITPGTPNLAIMTENLPVVDETKFAKGIKIITAEHLREMPEVKSTNYMKVILLAKQMKAQGAADVLYHHQGELSELSRSNLFLFKKDTLITPHHNVLKGVTRRVVLELAADNFRIEQRPVYLTELAEADEVFTTGTTKKVMPIVQVDNQPVGRGRPGERTRFLLGLFDKLTQQAEVPSSAAMA
ncbi:MAG: aminotransferase class IV [Bernardetiaceae bacterium]|jgi:D-alanine transaminase/branched-chain amino acid aminotransferase|nr:aminotransferase class IV [Bernardetiaceae bacterium]